MIKNKVKYLVGSSDVIVKPRMPFDNLVCSFLDDLSRILRSDIQAKRYADIQSFAFWCRRANIQKIKSQQPGYTRMGRGYVFHIAPSNIPINFAFSLAFGLLAGNGNIIRVSNKKFEQVNIMCRVIKKLVTQECYNEISKLIQIVSYEKDQEITDYFSNKCDARVIWGGDNTVNEIRKSSLSPRAVEITFTDRYSFGIIDAETVALLEEKELSKVAQGFYNDTYLMDQNACSTPHILFWKYKDEIILKAAKDRFWKAIFEKVQKYELADIKVSDKYTSMCQRMANMREIECVERKENYIYVYKLKSLPKSIEGLRGRYGEFFEYDIKDLNEVSLFITNRVQTCVTLGVRHEEVIEMIINNQLQGVDRIVPFGKALDIETIWDGYDIIGNLSRVIKY